MEGVVSEKEPASETCLDGLEFSQDVKCLSTHFTGISCKDAVFHASIELVDCIVNGLADFEGADFKGTLKFVRCTFNDFVMLRGANLPDRCVFEECQFNGGLSMASGLSRAGGVEVECTVIKHVKFKKCSFSGYVTFNNRAFSRSAAFSECVFFDPPHFQNTIYHSGTSFDGCDFRCVSTGDSVRKTRAEAAFRSLKRRMQDIGDIERMGLFAARELQVRRSHPNTSFFEKALITVYGLGADFGRSTVRPFALLAIVTLANLTALVLLGEQMNHDAVLDAGWFLLSQTAAPFSAFNPSFTLPMASETLAAPNGRWIWGSIALVQSLTLVIAIALLVFSIRRRFQ